MDGAAPRLSKRQPESWLAKKDLEVGAWYAGNCRNSRKARWTGEVFEYERTKFGSTYWDTVEHPEDDQGYDLFFPVKKIENVDEWVQERCRQWDEWIKNGSKGPCPD